MLSSRAFPAHINTRTPGRSTKNRGENATGFFAAHKSTKQTYTPYHSSTSTNTKSPSKKSTVTQSRPFQDKTPFPNRTVGNLRTPAPGLKKGRLAGEEFQFSFDLNTPALFKSNDNQTTPLPSSLRKNIKLPRGSGQFAPVTPMNKGNHWDVIEDLEFELPEEKVEAELTEQPATEADDDDWEIEYMPPKSEVPYQPPFDFEIPDYKAVGETLRNFRPMTIPKPPPKIDFTIDPSIDLCLKYTILAEQGPDIDDPFYKPPKATVPTDTARKPLAGLTHRRVPTATPANVKSTQARPPVVTRPRSATTSINRVPNRPVSSVDTSKRPLTRPTTATGMRPKPQPTTSQPSTRPSSVAATHIARSASLARGPGIRTVAKPDSGPKAFKKDKDGIVLNFFESDVNAVDEFSFVV